MEKRPYLMGALVVFLFLIFLLFIFGIIFQNAFQNFTGKTFSKGETIYQSKCYDSDGRDFYNKGYREFNGVIKWDYCSDLNGNENGSTHVVEFYCSWQWIKECSEGCLEGKCLPNK